MDRSDAIPLVADGVPPDAHQEGEGGDQDEGRRVEVDVRTSTLSVSHKLLPNHVYADGTEAVVERSTPARCVRA